MQPINTERRDFLYAFKGKSFHTLVSHEKRADTTYFETLGQLSTRMLDTSLERDTKVQDCLWSGKRNDRHLSQLCRPSRVLSSLDKSTAPLNTPKKTS